MLKVHDFIEIDFTGRLKDGKVFDTTEKAIASASGLDAKMNLKPMIVCLGEGQILPGLEQELIGKEVGKQYTINLPPEKAFGKRDIKKIRIMPVGAFKEHKMTPSPGLQINVDGEIGTITSISGGRVIVNFNHPLSGKEVIFSVTIRRLLADPKEKILSYLESMFRIPQGQVKLELSEQKATLQLPFELPGPFLTSLEQKLVQLIGLSEAKILVHSQTQ